MKGRNSEIDFHTASSGKPTTAAEAVGHAIFLLPPTHKITSCVKRKKIIALTQSGFEIYFAQFEPLLRPGRTE
jgi:hypothetical protein